MRIMVVPEHLRSLARQLTQVSEELRAAAGHTHNALQRLDWEARQRAGVDGAVGNARSRAGALAGQAESLARYLEGRAQAFADADQQPVSISAGTIAAPGAMVVVVAFGAVVLILGLAAAIWWKSQDMKGLSEEEAQKRIEDILNKTEEGRAALKAAKDLDVKFKLSPEGAGTWYDPNTNTMYVDPSTQQDLAAEGYVHEITHAKQSFPDPYTTSEDAYVEQCLEYEAEAVIAEFKYEKERPVLDFIVQSEPEKAYWDTYNSTLEELKQSSPGMSEAEIEQAAYEAGREKVEEYFRSGYYVTSTTGESYDDYYRGAWNDSQSEKEAI